MAAPCVASPRLQVTWSSAPAQRPGGTPPGRPHRAAHSYALLDTHTFSRRLARQVRALAGGLDAYCRDGDAALIGMRPVRARGSRAGLRGPTPSLQPPFLLHAASQAWLPVRSLFGVRV